MAQKKNFKKGARHKAKRIMKKKRMYRAKLRK